MQLGLLLCLLGVCVAQLRGGDGTAPPLPEISFDPDTGTATVRSSDGVARSYHVGDGESVSVDFAKGEPHVVVHTTATALAAARAGGADTATEAGRLRAAHILMDTDADGLVSRTEFAEVVATAAAAAAAAAAGGESGGGGGGGGGGGSGGGGGGGGDGEGGEGGEGSSVRERTAGAAGLRGAGGNRRGAVGSGRAGAARSEQIDADSDRAVRALDMDGDGQLDAAEMQNLPHRCASLPRVAKLTTKLFAQDEL